MSHDISLTSDTC